MSTSTKPNEGRIDDALAHKIKALMEESEWTKAGELIEPLLTTPLCDTKILSLAITCFRNARSAEKLDKIYENVTQLEKIRSTGRYVTNGLPFIGVETANPHNEYVFVSGAPRSGTTSFGRILNLHYNVAILTERYTPFFGYHPDMFLGKNIFSSGYRRHRHAPAIDKLKPKLEKARWIGDKRPNFAFGAAITNANFAGKELRIFHIHRDIRDVCWSYEGKKKRSLDEWSYQQACFDYNYNNCALYKALAEVHSGVQAFTVEYELLHTDVDYALEVFKKLDIETNSAFKGRLTKYIIESSKVLGKDRDLSPEVNQYIDDNVDWAAEEALKKMSLA